MIIRHIRAAPQLSRCSCAAFRMPLRAKVRWPSMPMSTAARPINSSKESPEEDPDDVVFKSTYGVRTIELNRPGKLNSLNRSMIQKITPRLLEWESSDLANIIIISGAGPKAFCAGGDVAALVRNNVSPSEASSDSTSFFSLEYQLDHLIATTPKPYLAYMDGITMGGGAGLSVHAPVRVATERTLFAFPETAIGFFPDVGASFFLSRLDGALGAYLAMTSARLKGVDAFLTGIATHYIHSSSLPDLTARLAELRFKDYLSLQDKYAIINRTLAEHATGLPHDDPPTMVGEVRMAVDRCFSAKTVSEVLTRLDTEAQSNSSLAAAWASQTLDTLRERSPTSVAVALRQMQDGRKWNIAETFQREHALANNLASTADFRNGVTAKLIDKPPTKPIWKPSELGSSKIDTNGLFNVEGLQRLKLLREGKSAEYPEYPHRQFTLGLPDEAEVRGAVMEKRRTREDVAAYLMQKWNGRQGVAAVVTDILQRKTIVESDSGCTWANT